VPKGASGEDFPEQAGAVFGRTSRLRGFPRAGSSQVSQHLDEGVLAVRLQARQHPLGDRITAHQDQVPRADPGCPPTVAQFGLRVTAHQLGGGGELTRRLHRERRSAAVIAEDYQIAVTYRERLDLGAVAVPGRPQEHDEQRRLASVPGALMLYVPRRGYRLWRAEPVAYAVEPSAEVGIVECEPLGLGGLHQRLGPGASVDRPACSVRQSEEQTIAPLIESPHGEGVLVLVGRITGLGLRPGSSEQRRRGWAQPTPPRRRHKPASSRY
jgi:hypothetical protein